MLDRAVRVRDNGWREIWVCGGESDCRHGTGTWSRAIKGGQRPWIGI